MLRSFIISAVRHLSRDGLYTSLNVLGLSVGLACFTLISLWVSDELSYDKFHQKSDRIYRISSVFTDESGQFSQAVTPIPLAPALERDLPEVEAALRIDVNDAIVRVDDKEFVEEDILAVDPSFFELFDFDLLKGSSRTALQDPYSIILSESMAAKYFAGEDPIGKSLTIFAYDPDGKGAEYKVTGVVEDCPPNSHFNYNFLFSFSTLEKVRPELFTDGWFDNGWYTYVLLKPGVNRLDFSDKITTFLERYIGADMRKYKIRWDYFLQPLTEIHLHSDLRYEIRQTGRMSHVIVFLTIGFIVLLLAAINYVNLSTAYASGRFREVGVRKVMGALKGQLMLQHIIEAWVVAMLSLGLAVVMIEIARPLFESVIGREVTNLYSLNVFGFLFLLASVVGILSGLYPAFVISSSRTVQVLKGTFRTGASAVFLRKSLVVFQYAVTITLIIGILVVRMQLFWMQEKDLGFDKDNLLVLDLNGSQEVMEKYEGFKNAVLSDPSISYIARSSSMIAGGLGNGVAVTEDVSGHSVNITMYRLGIDHNYIQTYGMKLIAGRSFLEGSPADSSGFIINEAAYRQLGYTNPEEIIGKKFHFSGREGQVLGVVHDFHYNSLQHRVEPTAMLLLNGWYSRITVRLNNTVPATVASVENVWKKYFPNSLFQFSFAGERIGNQYHSEKRFSKVFVVFSGISLVIACIGLFSLVSYAVRGRKKEIGIRKVLGASTGNIVGMLSMEFLVLIFIACAFAIPAGFYLMDQWLQDFSYRIALGLNVFVSAVGAALVIALVTILARVIRSATSNPVDALRSE